MERTKNESTFTVAEDKIWVSVTYKINLGNWENLEISAGVSQTIPKGKSPYSLFEDISEKLYSRVFSKVEESREKIDEFNFNKP